MPHDSTKLPTAPHDEYYHRLQERLIRYARVHTTSDADSAHIPSSACQVDLLQMLYEELYPRFCSKACLSEQGYLIAYIPATKGCEEVPTLALLAHVDTSPEAPGVDVCPMVHSDYDGGTITLPHSSLTTELYPELGRFIGHTLVSSDGSTLLGADDKAGVAIMVTLAEWLQLHPTVPHGAISLAFTTDEEVGRGLEAFDESLLGAQYAYTIDGGIEGELEYECFHAAGAIVRATGHNTHPGSGYGVMRSAIEALVRVDYELGRDERPYATQGREGFLHLLELSGDVSSAEAHYIIRDHDRSLLEDRIQRMRRVIKEVNDAPNSAALSLDVSYQYKNMYDYIAPHPEVIDIALEAYRSAGIKPIVQPIRGGTDGAELSRRGIPCPNIFGGGVNFHSTHEFCSIDSMRRCLDMLGFLVQGYTRL